MKRNRIQIKRRQEGADDRQLVSDALTPKERLARLDRRLGKGLGAARERARLEPLVGPQEIKSKKKSKNSR